MVRRRIVKVVKIKYCNLVQLTREPQLSLP